MQHLLIWGAYGHWTQPIALIAHWQIGRTSVTDEEKKKRRDSVSMVGPYARIRIIVAVLCFFIAFTVIAFRMFSG